MSAGTFHVLLVEDNDQDILLFQHTLAKLGRAKSLQITKDAEMAIQFLEHAGHSHPIPTLVFLDLNLPGKSGFEVLTWLRGQPKFRRALVVVLTGSSQTIDIYRAYELGADSYLVKPVTVAGVRRTLATLKEPREYKGPVLPGADSLTQIARQ